MHLAPCAPPAEPTEPAPLTELALCLVDAAVAEPAPARDGASATLDAVWSADDGYYVRCTEGGGALRWYRVADGGVAPGTTGSVTSALASGAPPAAVTGARLPEVAAVRRRLVFRVRRGPGGAAAAGAAPRAVSAGPARGSTGPVVLVGRLRPARS